jgi:hypothetical protein
MVESNYYLDDEEKAVADERSDGIRSGIEIVLHRVTDGPGA